MRGESRIGHLQPRCGGCRDQHVAPQPWIGGDQVAAVLSRVIANRWNDT